MAALRSASSCASDAGCLSRAGACSAVRDWPGSHLSTGVDDVGQPVLLQGWLCLDWLRLLGCAGTGC